VVKPTAARVGALVLAGVVAAASTASAQQEPTPDDLVRAGFRDNREAASAAENEYYRLLTLPLPPEVVMEVGGLLQMSDGRIMAATRRGDVYIVEGAYSDPPAPTFKLFASGLAQPLGLLELDGWIYFAQRGELSRMRDTDGDDRVDVIETVTDDWALSGNYHEYAFGPRLTPDGKLWVTLNKPFGEEPYGQADWRGWAMRVDPETGVAEPVVGGLRSPAGVEVSPWGDVFYTDNQGEWCNASKLSILKVGDFHGHPHGMGSAVYPESQVEPLPEDQNLEGVMMKDLDTVVPNFRMPAVWFPYAKLGQSPSGFKWDTTGGGFGPFENQVFVGDQHHAMIMRVFLEEVDGHWQGAAFVFRQGLQSGVIRVAFGGDDSLFVGMSARGWSGIGPDPYGLERLVWTGKMPFEVHAMRATSDGFELTFTEAVDPATAANPASYAMESYTYRLSERYGGPEEDKLAVNILRADVAADAMSVRLTIDPIRAGYVHELHMPGVRNAAGAGLLHAQAYYTLVRVPRGISR
jgi:glucose/arabinose dehydrogenase